MDAAVEQVVEGVCRQGCDYVRQCMAALQSADTLPEYAHLAPAQRDSLLRELQAVMSIYDERC